eukprot:scaffold234351_cov16-Tisochrysis_lutea.AAC.2
MTSSYAHSLPCKAKDAHEIKQDAVPAPASCGPKAQSCVLITYFYLQVDAFFSEPVLPLSLSSLSSKHASVKSVDRIDPQHTRFLLEGHVGTEAQASLVSYADYAGNTGKERAQGESYRSGGDKDEESACSDIDLLMGMFMYFTPDKICSAVLCSWGPTEMGKGALLEEHSLHAAEWSKLDRPQAVLKQPFPALTLPYS